MKFDKRLACYVAESSGQDAVWVSYKALKKCLKAFRRLPGEDSWTDRSTDKAARAEVATEEQEFVKKLDEDLAKVNEFFIEKEEESVIRLQLLTERLDASTSREEREDIRKAFVDFHGQLVLLLNWALLNYAAVAKILKKHDKVTGAGLKDPYLAAVLHQPFCSTGAISNLARLVENKVRELGPAGAEQASTNALSDCELPQPRAGHAAASAGGDSATAAPEGGCAQLAAHAGVASAGLLSQAATPAGDVEALPDSSSIQEPKPIGGHETGTAGPGGPQQRQDCEDGLPRAGCGVAACGAAAAACSSAPSRSAATSRTSSCSDFALGLGLDHNADAILRRTQAALGLWAELQHSAHTPSTVLPCAVVVRSADNASDADEPRAKRQRSS